MICSRSISYSRGIIGYTYFMMFSTTLKVKKENHRGVIWWEEVLSNYLNQEKDTLIIG